MNIGEKGCDNISCFLCVQFEVVIVSSSTALKVSVGSEQELFSQRLLFFNRALGFHLGSEQEFFRQRLLSSETAFGITWGVHKNSVFVDQTKDPSLPSLEILIRW